MLRMSGRRMAQRAIAKSPLPWEERGWGRHERVYNIRMGMLWTEEQRVLCWGFFVAIQIHSPSPSTFSSFAPHSFPPSQTLAIP